MRVRVFQPEIFYDNIPFLCSIHGACFVLRKANMNNYQCSRYAWDLQTLVVACDVIEIASAYHGIDMWLRYSWLAKAFYERPLLSLKRELSVE